MGVPNPIYWHISSYSFIFSTYSVIFVSYSYIFWHIPSYFPHIPSFFDIFLHNISHIPSDFLQISFIFTTSRNSRIWCHQGWWRCTCKFWNYPLGPDLEIFLNPSDIFSNVTSSGVLEGGGGCTRKSWYYLAGHKTWNMSIWRNMWLWGVEERSTEQNEVPVVIYFSPYIKALELGKIPSSPHIVSGTWKNSGYVQVLGLERAKRGDCRRIYLGLGKILSFGIWENCERSLEARLKRHETWFLFFSLANKS